MGRRSARVPIIVPITIRGVDRNGEPFNEDTWTMGINKQGAKIVTFQPLPPGTEISVFNPALGREVKAHVIWRSEKRYQEDPYEVGIELLESTNVWAVKFPPEDWQRGMPRREAGGAEQGATPEPAGLPPEQRAEPLDLQSAKLARQLDSEIEDRFQQVAQRLRQLEEREASARSVEQQLDALAGRLDSSRQSVEALLAKAQEFYDRLDSLSQDADRRVHEAGREALDSEIKAIGERVRREVEAASMKSLGEARSRAQDEAAATLQTLAQSADNRISKLLEERLAQAHAQLQARQAAEIEGARPQLVEVVQTAARDLTDKLRKVADEMRIWLTADVEKSLESLVAQSASRLTQRFEALAQTTSQNAERSAQERLQKIQEQAEQEASGSLLQKFQHKIDAQLEAQIRSAAEKHREAILERIRRDLEESRERAAAWVKTKSEEVMTEASESLYTQVGAGAIVLRDWAEQTRNQLESLFQKSVEAFHRQTAEVARHALERNRREFDVLVDEIQARLEQAVRVLKHREPEPVTRPHEPAAPPAEPAPLPRKKSEEYLTQMIEHLRAPEHAVSDETKEFRRKLAEALTRFQAGSKPSTK